MFIARLTRISDGQPVYVNMDRVWYFCDAAVHNKTGTLLCFADEVTALVAEPVEQVAGLIPGGAANPERGYCK